MMFHLFLVVLMHLVEADLLGYNRGVNTSYQHVKTVMKSAISQSNEHDYGAQLISFMLKQGNADMATALFKQLSANKRTKSKANNAITKQKRRRHNRYYRRRQ